MAKTIINAFEQFKKNLEITGLQKQIVSTRQANVRKAVENGLTVIDSFLTGSYSRSTMIAPLGEADIDIFVVLDSSYYQKYKPASLLDKVREILLKTYPKTPKISRNGQAVTITFTDFLVDVVPAFNRKGGGYLIPDSKSGVWIETNPKIHVDYVSNQNSLHNSDLIPLIKMIKGWNRVINNGFTSFYIELLVIKVLKDVTISDFPSGCRYIFDKGREAIKWKIDDPAGYGGKINGLQNVKTVEDAIKRFETAYNRAVSAESHARRGSIEDAINEWKKIFDGYFPAYG